jgi:hypothetical protein
MPRRSEIVIVMAPNVKCSSWVSKGLVIDLGIVIFEGNNTQSSSSLVYELSELSCVVCRAMCMRMHMCNMS